MKIFNRLLLAAYALTFTACASFTTPSTPVKNVDISKILDQINMAISKSIPDDPNFPALSTITMDMQVGVSTTVGGKVPISIVSLSPEVDNQKVQHMVIDFVPTVTRATAAVEPKKEDGPLAAAIAALYQSVAHTPGAYTLRHASISLQCTFKAEGTAGVSLTPVSITGSVTRQMVQTLTIQFGRDPNKYIVGAGTASGGGGATQNATPTSTPATEKRSETPSGT